MTQTLKRMRRIGRLALSLLMCMPIASATHALAVPPVEMAPPPPGYSASAQQAAAEPTVSSTSYRIASGDRLRVMVYNGEKLSGEYLVDADGRIAMPMVGRIDVAGLTVDEVGGRITARLADGYLVNPSVIVDMVAFRDVFILGEVQRPGAYPYKPGMTVYQLVAQAGGFSYRASRKTVRLRSANATQEQKVRITSSTPVKAGDTVVIVERFF